MDGGKVISINFRTFLRIMSTGLLFRFRKKIDDDKIFVLMGSGRSTKTEKNNFMILFLLKRGPAPTLSFNKNINFIRPK